MRPRTSWRLRSLGIALAALLLAACTVSATVAPTPTSTSPAPKAAISQVTKSLTETQNSAATDEINVRASCPSGATMVGGGYHLQPTSNTQLIFIRASYPSAPSDWTVIETNPQSGGEVMLTAYVVCLTASFPVAVSITTATATDGSGVATCAAGTTLTGGGFQQAKFGSNVIDASYPSGSGWHVSNVSEIPESFTVYAMCATHTLAAAEITSSTTSIANNTEGTAAATCKAGQLLVGGGYTFAQGVGYFLGKHARVADGLTSWTITAYNLYMPGVGVGPTPTPPPPLDVTAYAICVTPSP